MMKQQELGITTANESDKKTTVADFRFDPQPIKGQPELKWRGKRPFVSTSYFPAQEKEQHGEEVNGWLNKIFWGDNIQVMSHLLKEYRGKVDLIYIDPPFDSKADYKKEIKLRGKKVENDHSSFEEKQYTDIWTNDEYLQFMYERLILCRELLSNTGSIYLHMDEKRSHYLKCIMDQVFGSSNFRKEIIWDITVLSGFKVQAQNWIRGHDSILYYVKSGDHIFNKLRQPHQQKYIDMFNQVDEHGERYLVAHGLKRYLKDVVGKGKPFGDVWDDLTSYQIFRKGVEDIRNMEQLAEYLCETKRVQNYSDVWDDVMSFQQQPTSAENVQYPTQKPEALLERIIKASSNPGDLVFDCFMGSGTTQAVAMKLGRRFIGADINLGAIQTTTKRLINVAAELNQELPDREHPKYTGFSVYNVNNYDVFRNPVEAKDLLVQALELDPLPGNTVYDGLDEDWYVKIMPVNRIATRQDLNEIEANFPIKEAEKFKLEHPNKVFQKIRLVCMGHEPALDAELKKMIPYNIEVEILDILRDKSDLRFKRDAEAKIRRTKKKLVIEKFYPMNLMEKLSMQKEKVKDWREMVESVMIDFNYDGSVFTPTVTDIPEKDEFVKGEYDIPEDAGTIRVKITDLLSESLEQEVS